MGNHVVWVGDSNLILISDKNIIEWRYGGYEASPSFRIFEYKYVNGVQTIEKRYTGKYYSPSIKLTATTALVAIDETYQIVIASNTATNKTVTYTSSNASVADVDKDGIVYGFLAGTAVITAKNANGDSITCTITVLPKISAPTQCFFTVNSVDGITLWFMAKNQTGKEIKYITARIIMYNRVGDYAYDEITGKYGVAEKLVGPIENGDTICIYDLIAYSAVCYKVTIEAWKIEYMDGTSETIDYSCAAYENTAYE
jgi:hypothetical protein